MGWNRKEWKGMKWNGREEIWGRREVGWDRTGVRKGDGIR